MGKAIRRVQAACATLMLATLGFFGAQPAMATETNPGPSTEQPGETPSPDPNPIDPLPVDPIPGNPVTTPPVVPTDPAPAPVDPTPAPVPPPVIAPVVPVAPPSMAPALPPVVPSPVADPATSLPVPEESSANLEPVIPIDNEVPASADVTPTPTPTPTPITTKKAAPVVSADITGPLKVALAPVAENNPVVQGLTVLVLILLGVAYFRALRSKGAPRPRLNGK